MNHVLKEVEADCMKNIQTYSNPELPLKEEFLKGVVEFIGRRYFDNSDTLNTKLYSKKGVKCTNPHAD